MVVDGRSGRCTSPPLVLHADGTYKIWAEQGTYRIDGNQLKLSESKKHGWGQLLRGRQIVFEFTYRRKKHKVTFRRSDPLEAGQSSGRRSCCSHRHRRKTDHPWRAP